MVQQVLRQAPEEESGQPECRHHWIIDTPEGPLSRGTCRLCGEAREFKNYIEADQRTDDPSPATAQLNPSKTSSDGAEDLEEL